MEIKYSKRLFVWSLIILIGVYLVLYFGFDLSISEYAKNTLKWDKSPFVLGFSWLVGGLNIQLLAFSLFVVYFILRKHEFARGVLYVALTISVALLLTDVLKYIFGRARPEAYFKDHIYGMQWFKTKGLYNSTPSGHSTRAMALCASLAFLCKTRWLQIVLLVFAVVQALCRVILLDHYLSDVIFGLWLGFFVALFIHSLMFEQRSSRV